MNPRVAHIYRAMVPPSISAQGANSMGRTPSPSMSTMLLLGVVYRVDAERPYQLYRGDDGQELAATDRIIGISRDKRMALWYYNASSGK